MWRIAADDEKVRDSHLAADGQVRFTHEPFQIGDAALMEPRDPNGPPEETYNCRCTREDYSLSDLPKDLLTQIEHRLTEEQRLLARGIRVTEATVAVPSNPAADLAKQVLEAEKKLNSGGIIRNLKPFEALVHYMMGTGKAVTVTFDQVSKGIDFVRGDSDKKILKELSKLKSTRQFGATITINIKGISIAVDQDLFGRVEFDVNGTISGNVNGWRVIGDVSAQTDTYNFNPSNRSMLAETIVTAVRTLGKVVQAKPFDIHFHGSKKMTAKGIWKEIP